MPRAVGITEWTGFQIKRSRSQLCVNVHAKFPSVSHQVLVILLWNVKLLNFRFQSPSLSVFSCDILDHEALGISSIFWKLTSENSKFIFSPSESFKVIREPFFKKMTELTCYFACKAATEEVVSQFHFLIWYDWCWFDGAWFVGFIIEYCYISRCPWMIKYSWRPMSKCFKDGQWHSSFLKTLVNLYAKKTSFRCLIVTSSAIYPCRMAIEDR